MRVIHRRDDEGRLRFQAGVQRDGEAELLWLTEQELRAAPGSVLLLAWVDLPEAREAAPDLFFEEPTRTQANR